MKTFCRNAPHVIQYFAGYSTWVNYSREIVKAPNVSMQMFFLLPADVISEAEHCLWIICDIMHVPCRTNKNVQHWNMNSQTYFSCSWCLIFTACVCRDLIRVLKWYVDRIIDAEHQEQIQQVLKVRMLTYTSFKMYVTVQYACKSMRKRIHHISLCRSVILKYPHPLLFLYPDLKLPLQQLWIPMMHLLYLSSLSHPQELLFLPIMQLSYKHSVFSFFLHSPILLLWPAVGPPGTIFKCMHAHLHPSKVLFKSNSHFLTLNPYLLWIQCVPFIFWYFCSFWLKCFKAEIALHTVSTDLFIYLFSKSHNWIIVYTF